MFILWMVFKYNISDERHILSQLLLYNGFDIFTREVYQEIISDSLKYCKENKGLSLTIV